MSKIPDHAEQLDALGHIMFERTPSRLCPGFEQERPILTCPNCQRRSPLPNFTKPLTCECGLSMQVTGTFLAIWRDEPVPV